MLVPSSARNVATPPRVVCRRRYEAPHELFYTLAPMDSVKSRGHTVAQRRRIGHTSAHRPRQTCKTLRPLGRRLTRRICRGLLRVPPPPLATAPGHPSPNRQLECAPGAASRSQKGAFAGSATHPPQNLPQSGDLRLARRSHFMLVQQLGSHANGRLYLGIHTDHGRGDALRSVPPRLAHRHGAER
jgi:hypothetical protein